MTPHLHSFYIKIVIQSSVILKCSEEWEDASLICISTKLSMIDKLGNVSFSVLHL